MFAQPNDLPESSRQGRCMLSRRYLNYFLGWFYRGNYSPSRKGAKSILVSFRAYHHNLDEISFKSMILSCFLSFLK